MKFTRTGRIVSLSALVALVLACFLGHSSQVFAFLADVSTPEGFKGSPSWTGQDTFIMVSVAIAIGLQRAYKGRKAIKRALKRRAAKRVVKVAPKAPKAA